MTKFKIILLLNLLLLNTQGLLAQTVISPQDKQIKSSVVKIFTVASQSDFNEPWSSHVREFSGSGCIIKGNRILTNAHVVTDATYVEVLKNGEVKRYEAEILSIDHEADLALVGIKDQSFFDETKSLEIGGLPELQTEVNVYGFPMGGETLSITKGVVSRIENQPYSNSGKYLLSIQIDAAINSGNSGGPALSHGKIVGLVMQGNVYAENMGYIIPTSIINHFLEDIKDKRYDGYPFLGMMTQSLQSPVMKEMYGLKGEKYGILINRTIPNSPASRVLQRGDILISLDGHKVFSNYKIEFREKEFTDFDYIIDQHQMGDTIKLTILREGKEHNLSVVLDKKANELTLAKKSKPETRPSYFIYGGLVFVPGIREHDLPSKYYTLYPDEKREELVMLKQVLSSSLTKGLSRYAINVIDNINGKKFKNFDEFVALIENSQEKFIVLEDEFHTQMVLNRKDVLKNQKKILEQYNIKSAKSDDLLAKND